MLNLSVGQMAGQLPDMLLGLGPDDQIGLTQHGRIVARIVPEHVGQFVPERPVSAPRVRGACKGMLDIIDDGDDAVLEQFGAYIP
jgi:hypothetical protein